METQDDPAIILPDGWTWPLVRERRAKWGISADMVPVANAPGCTAWGHINTAPRTPTAPAAEGR
jgi:hypothetical protein